MMKTVQKRVFSACWTLATTADAFICVSRANFKKWLWKQCKIAFYRHVEHLRLLHMPLFAFLEQISKIDDENTAKTRFFGLLNICEYCICLYLRFLSGFQSWWWKHGKNAFFWQVEHLRLLHMPLFAFQEPISKIDDENSAKTRFSACWTFATAAYAFICVSRAKFKNW